MKRLALVAAVLFISACSPKNEEPASDTAAAVPAAAPAPAASDTAMAHDSAMKADSAKADTTKK